MRNLITRWLSFFLCVGAAFGGAFDPVANLYAPSVGEVGYGLLVNQNFFPKITDLLPLDLYTAPVGAIPGDAVYIISANTVALSDASVLATAKIAGFIKEKPTPTTARVLKAGRIQVFAGLTPAGTYYLSAANPGEITLTPPISPNFQIIAGVAKNATTLAIPTASMADPLAGGGDLQDTYDRGVSAAVIKLDVAGAVDVQDNSSVSILKILEAGYLEMVDVRPPSGSEFALKDVGGSTRLSYGTGNPLFVGGETGAPANLQEWRVFPNGPGNIKSHIDAAGSLVFDDATVRFDARSSPVSTVATPGGEVWYTNNVPDPGFTVNTAHIFNSVTGLWETLGSGDSQDTFTADVITSTAAQTIFPLSANFVGVPGGLNVVMVNGIGGYDEGVDYTITASAVTFAAPQVLNDVVLIYYQNASISTGKLRFRERTFTATAAQTVFNLIIDPFFGAPDGFSSLTVNGLKYVRGTDYTLSGITLTWLDPFVLSAGAIVSLNYQIQ